jgi:hypothetical protein
MGLDGSARQACRSVRVPGVKRIFALAPSPVGTSVLFYGSTERAEGEYVRGALFRLRLDTKAGAALKVTVPLATNPAAAVWQPDGKAAYFEADQGVYRLESGGQTPELLCKGTVAGLAISSDGALLAFWRLGRDAYDLVVLDVNRKREAHTWHLETRFGADVGSFDLAFAPDGTGLYARTFDERGATPLKRFDLTTGSATVVTPDCYSVVAATTAVYFIAATGGTTSLQKIVTGSRSNVIVPRFHSDQLVRGGNPRWLLSQDYRTRAIVVLDTQTDTIEPLGTHEAAGMLQDGRLLFVEGDEITIGGASCKSGESR